MIKHSIENPRDLGWKRNAVTGDEDLNMEMTYWKPVRGKSGENGIWG